MLAATSVIPSAASYLETGVVVDRTRDPILSRRLDDLMLDLGVEVVDVTAGQARLARQAYRDYGSRRHAILAAAGPTVQHRCQQGRDRAHPRWRGADRRRVSRGA
ncbi:MAG: type II toxin-antitoxin system VapC family toxin [Ornithinimicrobium sp.]